MDKKELIAALVDLVSEKESEASRYYTQDNSPLPKRTLLRLVREGKVRGYKEGRTVLVLRDDLHTYLENERRVLPRQQPGEEETTPRLTLLDRVAGI